MTNSIPTFETNSIPTFEEAGLRWADDTPVVITSLRQAMQLLAQECPDPYALRLLIFFFSSLYRPDRLESSQEPSDAVVLRHWKSERDILEDIETWWQRDDELTDRLHAVIDQLDAIATFREVSRLAKANIHGNVWMTLNDEPGWKGTYTAMNRGFDWMVRCAFELELPDAWKQWLQLMYQKQPCQETCESIGYYQHEFANPAFDMSIREAALPRPDWVEHIIPLTEFWVRQALTIAHVWNMRLSTEAHQIQGEDDVMPPYPWCMAAYDKMRDRFHRCLEDPFSSYPYQLRLNVLRKLEYYSVFEECWGLVCEACPASDASSFNFVQVRLAVYHAVIRKAREVLRLRRGMPGNTTDDLNTIDDLDLAFEESFERFDEHGKYRLLQEVPEIETYELQYELLQWRALRNGMCDQWYPLPFEEDWDEEESSDGDSDDMENIEFEPAEDVQMEVYGPRIDIAQFTVDTMECGADAFCTWCQDTISPTESWEKRCVKPMSCSDIFHAECLNEWVNGVSQSSNLCPNCKMQMTPKQRARRPILTDQ